MGSVVEHTVILTTSQHGRRRKVRTVVPLMQVLWWVANFEANDFEDLRIRVLDAEGTFSISWFRYELKEICYVEIDGNRGEYSLQSQICLCKDGSLTEWQSYPLHEHLSRIKNNLNSLDLAPGESLGLKGNHAGEWYPLLMSWFTQQDTGTTEWVMYSPHGLTHSQLGVPSVRLDSRKEA